MELPKVDDAAMRALGIDLTATAPADDDMDMDDDDMPQPAPTAAAPQPRCGGVAVGGGGRRGGRGGGRGGRRASRASRCSRPGPPRPARRSRRGRALGSSACARAGGGCAKPRTTRPPRAEEAAHGPQRGQAAAAGLAASLGDAHSHFARGRHAEAMTLLSEVIRQAPSVPDSYHTLGLIYEGATRRSSRSKCSSSPRTSHRKTPRYGTKWLSSRSRWTIASRHSTLWARAQARAGRRRHRRRPRAAARGDAPARQGGRRVHERSPSLPTGGPGARAHRALALAVSRAPRAARSARAPCSRG